MFREFKPVLLVLGRFLGVYLVLIFLYQLYLNAAEGSGLDVFSRWVARQAVALQQILGYSSTVQEFRDNSVLFIIREQPVSRMVEGCNALSVMILFMAFVLAFYRKKVTIPFILAGLLLLHVTNVLRIALLNVVLYEAQEYGKTLHDYLFPAVIYGAVVVLWLIWMKKFALKPRT